MGEASLGAVRARGTRRLLGVLASGAGVALAAAATAPASGVGGAGDPPIDAFEEIVAADQTVLDELLNDPGFAADADGQTDISWFMDPYGLTTVYLLSSAGGDELLIDTATGADLAWVHGSYANWMDKWREWLEDEQENGE